jgi:hypothetical protein
MWLRNKRGIWSLLAVLCTASLGDCVAATFPISVVACPRKLNITVPTPMLPPRTADDKALKQRVLDGLHSNPGRTARYSEMFLADWSADNPVPSIFVSSLGSVRARQGKFTPEQWNELKAVALSANKSQREEWMRKGLAERRPGMPSGVGNVEGSVEGFFADRQTEFTAIGTANATYLDQPMNYLSAMKMVFVDGCIVHLTFYVDARESDARSALLALVRHTTVLGERVPLE